MPHRTRLIVVSGASASGKTHIADALAAHLDAPVLHKDTFKESMMDAAPPETREESAQLGRLAWPVLFDAVEQIVGFVPVLIVEANFYRVFHHQTLADLATQTDMTLIRVRADAETTEARIHARRQDPSRHPGHFDTEGIEILLHQIETGQHDLDLPGVPTIDIDTSGDPDTDIAELAEQISRESTPPVGDEHATGP
jgi:predicted kinase